MFSIVAPIDLTKKPTGVVVSSAKNCSEREKMPEADRKMLENMLSTLRLQSGGVELDNTRVCSDQFIKFSLCGFAYLTLAYS